MLAYTLRRIVHSLLVLLVTVAAMFCLIRLTPGDAAGVMLGPRATEAQRTELRAKMGLDQALPMQFVRFVSHAVRGDLGRDVQNDVPVTKLVFQALPPTLALAGMAITWAAAIGIPLGCLCAMKQNSPLDRIVGVFAAGAVAFPATVAGIYALLFFSASLQWFPAIGGGRHGDPLDQLHHLILPSLTVSLAWVGYIARLVRANMLEVLRDAHIRTYRAYGVSDARIALRFVLPIAVVPVVAMLGVGMGSLISSAVIIEIIFTRPGLGRLIYDAVIFRNVPVAIGTVMVTAALYQVFNLCADLLVAALDPRVRAGL